MKRLLLVFMVVGIPIGTVLLHRTDAASPSEEGANQQAHWQRLRGMVGKWSGAGQPNNSRVEQSYELIVGDRFLLAQTKSVADAETHEDWEIFSFDSGRGKVILRQFVSEGFVNQYVLDEVTGDGAKFVFVSESCENAPQGFRTRQTLTFEDEDHVSQQLELAPAGREFSGCASTKVARVR